MIKTLWVFLLDFLTQTEDIAGGLDIFDKMERSATWTDESGGAHNNDVAG